MENPIKNEMHKLPKTTHARKPIQRHTQSMPKMSIPIRLLGENIKMNTNLEQKRQKLIEENRRLQEKIINKTRVTNSMKTLIYLNMKEINRINLEKQINEIIIEKQKKR